nr:beta-1,3-galactosyltransferase GALT1 [Tanacetum cinerariifolium]
MFKLEDVAMGIWIADLKKNGLEVRCDDKDKDGCHDKDKNGRDDQDKNGCDDKDKNGCEFDVPTKKNPDVSGCSLRWQPDEETLLAGCWVSVIDDPNVGAGQTKDTFWYWILNTQGHVDKQMAYVEPQLPKVQRHLQTNQAFGENDMNVMKRAKATYRDENKSISFVQDDAWEILRSHSKWDAPEPVDLTEGDVLGVGNEDLFGEAARPRLAGSPNQNVPKNIRYHDEQRGK